MILIVFHHPDKENNELETNESEINEVHRGCCEYLKSSCEII